MTNSTYFSIYVGSEYSNIHGGGSTPTIPKKWQAVLELAYAYTTTSINNAWMDLSTLISTVNDHSHDIEDLSNKLATLSYLNDEDFINRIDEIANKIERLDPDVLLGLSYAYTMLGDQLVQNNSYSYSYILYELGINRAYDQIEQIRQSLQSNINDVYHHFDDDYVTMAYAQENLAAKSEIPTKTSQLTNDSGFLTTAIVGDFVTASEVDERIQHVVGAAPDALDTLEEIANALDNNEDLAGYLTSLIEEKADLSYVTNLYHQTNAKNDDIPIFDDSKIEALNELGELPDKYISIPSADTLLQSNGSSRYLDIIFNTLRDLQAQVSKIQRTFDKGLISMTNEQTRMSYVVSEYSLTDESEPMWAVDPNSLTEITGAEFYVDNAHILEPTLNVLVGDGKLTISPYASWNDNHINITSGKHDNYLYDCEDAKEYVYFTVSYPNAIITLTNYTDDSRNISINLNQLNLPNNTAHKYNVLLCVSRAVKDDTNTYVGNNFIFVSIADYYTGNNIINKYYDINNNRFVDAYTKLNNDTSKNEENRYFISKIDFYDLELYRMTFYSKYQDFSNDVQPIVPDDDDTYSVAHITIRSVKNIEQLKKIKNQLLENELIYNDSNNCIYIIKNNEIKLISGGTTPDPLDDITGMETNEIIEWLQANGIVGLIEDAENNTTKLSFNNIEDITFINQLNEKYKFAVDSNGELKSTLIHNKTLANRIAESGMTVNENTLSANFVNTRGFVGTLRAYETLESEPTNVDKDMKLNSDRIKIGNIYAPFKNQSTFGCTHGYIELENTSKKDFELDGCYMHFVRRLNDDSVEEYSLPLSGVLPANGTYLIRCKKYSDIEQSNTFIDVNSFDIEWIIPEEVISEEETIPAHLFDMYLGEKQNTFLLTYGCPGKDRVPTSNFNFETPMITEKGGFKVYHPCYIDSVSIIGFITSDATGASYTWCGWKGAKGLYGNGKKLDALYKTTFELDPAKQAYQGLNWNVSKGSGKDSSRVRSNTATDYQTVYLQNEFIEFPKTESKYPVAMYTPMASYLHKNVGTDKTKLDMNKPNMVTCAFGINMLTTRCFNWVSAGEFDEYIWVRKEGDTEWKRFESYKTRALGDITKIVINEDNTETKVKIGIGDIEYNTYRSKLNNNTLTTPYRKEFTWITNNVVYARIHNSFPGTGIQYTAHKCIIEFAAATNSKITYEYIVGRGDKNKNPDEEHTSDIMRFTLYPSTYIPRLYQTTDQQGFHWIEYQTWGACANKINEIITTTQASENIVPVVLNTGDATQNGTRVNEWLDYYIGGKNLFNHLEQMSIVGNNDLCDNDVTILGTGDDSGKSNGYYHHVFYCYEVDEKLNNGTYIQKLETHNEGEDQSEDKTFDDVYNAKQFKYLPIIKGNDDVYRYIPSFYFFGTNKYTFVMMNSELTYVNCGKWFNRKKNGYTVNLYTGWTIPSEANDNTYLYDDGFTTVYTMLYNIISEHKSSKESTSTSLKNLIVACHEMPFTVVTHANLKSDSIDSDRSLNGTSLVGSHMNKMNANDAKANYWFSRLLEHFGVKFCYGGHKHTYAITNELRENYIYYVNNVKKYSLNKKMTMESTLENDTAEFVDVLKKNSGTITNYVFNTSNETLTEQQQKTVALSKYPIMKKSDDTSASSLEYGINEENSIVYPYYGISENTNGVIYMMCQATGFKLKSNKELPGPNQRFSFIIPKTTPNDPPKTDGPSDQQLVPMFTIIHPDTHKAYLIRLVHIHKGHPNDGTPPILSQLVYDNADITLEYLHRTNRNNINMYGTWTEDETVLLNW